MSNDRVQELIDFINGKAKFMDTQEQGRFFRAMLTIAEHELAHIKARETYERPLTRRQVGEFYTPKVSADNYINKTLQETNHEDD